MTSTYPGLFEKLISWSTSVFNVEDRSKIPGGSQWCLLDPSQGLHLRWVLWVSSDLITRDTVFHRIEEPDFLLRQGILELLSCLGSDPGLRYEIGNPSCLTFSTSLGPSSSDCKSKMFVSGVSLYCTDASMSVRTLIHFRSLRTENWVISHGKV